MGKKCIDCGDTKDVSFFYRRYDKGKKAYRNSCKDCLSKKKYNKLKKPRTVYTSDDDRIKAARQRARDWYKDNTEKAKNRIHEWQKSDHGIEKRKESLRNRKIDNPDYWRLKKKRDKAIRRSRELAAGPLDTSSLLVLESYNLITFESSGFTCEYCHDSLGLDYHLEHLVPLSKGGKNCLSNLGISCATCNLEKLAKTHVEYKPELEDYFNKRSL